MKLRAMTHADIPAGLHLCRASNWNQLDDDWRFFLDHGGASLALRGDVVVGTVAWLPFGRDFAWLSMMLVDPAERRSGIGSQLMEAALQALGDMHVRLDATPAGEPMYRRFGMQAEYELARTKVTAGEHPPSPRVRAIEPVDLPAIFARDRDVFGADRSRLLAELYRRAPGLAWTAGGAYCFGRPGHLYSQIGPVVADSAEAARELVDHCLSQHGGTTFALDVPKRADGLTFVVERPFLRMSRGVPRRRGIPEHVFAIAGPEFG
jgi:GNAT superfamily N-acetyltransferase